MQQEVFITFTATLACVYTFTNDDQSPLSPHIVGGIDADIRQYPFLVSMRLWNSHYCGGNIFSPTLIITAAHCVVEDLLPYITVVAGISTLAELGTERFLKKSYVHPKYMTDSNDYDISILVVSKPWTFKETIKPIAISKTQPPANSRAKVAGWGFKWINGINSNQLQDVVVRIVDRKTCAEAFKLVRKNLITNRMICAGSKEGGKDACQNDSGGPLIFKNRLLGIVSFGVGCGRKDFPGVYSSIPHYYNWIKNVSNIEYQAIPYINDYFYYI